MPRTWIPQWPHGHVHLFLAFVFGLTVLVVPRMAFEASEPGNNGTSVSLPTRVSLVPIDGETIVGRSNTLSYFARSFSNVASTWLDGKFLNGGWEEQPQSVTEVEYAVAIGETQYVHLAGYPGNTGVVDYDTIRNAGMHVIAPNADANTGSETVAWIGGDEPDLNMGPGDSPSTTTINCTTGEQTFRCTSGKCGYTAVQFWHEGAAHGASGNICYPIDGRAVFTGDGKGVLQFQSTLNGGAPAAPFLQWSDVYEADVYWFTDPHNWTGGFWGACQAFWQNPSAPACDNGSGPGLSREQAQLAANYETNVTKLREIQRKNNLPSKPILAAIETGCPFPNGLCVSSAQFTAAAWHAIIAGARGILWFQHNFSGPCVDFRTFIDGSNPRSPQYNCQIVPGETLHDLVQAVTAFNCVTSARPGRGCTTTNLNSVLMSPFALEYVRTEGGTVSVMTKYYNNRFYLFAASGQPGTPPPANQNVTFTLAGSPTTTVTVVNENRSLNVINGQFTDTFADANTVHIYQVQNNTATASPPMGLQLQ
jgi:hypothetical protein